MLEEVILVLTPLGLVIAGLAILWVQAHGRFRGRSASPDTKATAMSAAGWVLFLVGLFAGVGLMANVFIIVAWIVTAIVLLSLLYRYRSMERRSLLWMLMLAAERGIPLETAARVFAEERHDHIGARALDLAEYLEAGLPLALALKRSRLVFPHAVVLAVELGQQTDNLGGALRQTLGQAGESEIVLRSATERALYLVFVVIFGMAALAFMMAMIVPSFVKILDDFDVELPPMTELLIDITRLLADCWPLTVLAAVFLLAALIRSLSYYTGYSTRYLPGLSASWCCADRGVIMRWLAHAVRENRPLPDMMRLIGGYLTRRGLRLRLQLATRRIDRGADWAESLQTVGLIRRSEAAVFRSAERAGNLAWALDEMAEGAVRRSVYQLRAVLNVLFPATLLVLGGSVLYVMLAVLIPLFHIIQALT